MNPVEGKKNVLVYWKIYKIIKIKGVDQDELQINPVMKIIKKNGEKK